MVAWPSTGSWEHPTNLYSVHTLRMCRNVRCLGNGTSLQEGFPSDLLQILQGMYMRTGIALGPLCAGVVDGRNFRVFGSTTLGQSSCRMPTSFIGDATYMAG